MYGVALPQPISTRKRKHTLREQEKRCYHFQSPEIPPDPTRLQPIGANERRLAREKGTKRKQSMQRVRYLLSSLEVTDSSGTERTERGGVSKSGENRSDDAREP